MKTIQKLKQQDRQHFNLVQTSCGPIYRLTLDGLRVEMIRDKTSMWVLNGSGCVDTFEIVDGIPHCTDWQGVTCHWGDAEFSQLEKLIGEVA